uniref:Uncharacterized protein n=1 Tax=Picea sitchensis TaxID=3332 RepID=A9NMX8_PICSI|nr:unknown [Picea sitchensis]
MGVYGSLKVLLQRRKYVKLDGSTQRRRLRIAKLGGGRKRRRIWKFKLVRKIKIRRWMNPMVYLVKLRDAYVKMMLNLASSRVFSTDSVGGGFGPQYSVGGANPFGQRPLKEYDEKMLIEIYKTLVIQGEIQAAAMVAT